MKTITLTYDQATKNFPDGAKLWRVTVPYQHQVYGTEAPNLSSVGMDPVEVYAEFGMMYNYADKKVIPPPQSFMDTIKYRYFVDKDIAFYWKSICDQTLIDRNPTDPDNYLRNVRLHSFITRHKLLRIEEQIKMDQPDIYVDCNYGILEVLMGTDIKELGRNR